jgi:AFG3 family protein
VTKYGMSKLGYQSLEEDQSGYKYYSEKTNERIDAECMRIIKEEEEKCRELVKIHRGKIEEMSQVLLEKKTIEIGDILKVLGDRPFKVSEGFSRYAEEKLSGN